MKGTLRWFILALIGMWIIWVLTGGPNQDINNNTPFMDELSPIGTGKPYTLQQLRDGTRP